MRVRLAPGADVDRAIATINKAANDIRAYVSPAAQSPAEKRDAYVRWAVWAEGSLQSVLQRDDAQSFFNGSQHRDICSMPPGSQLMFLIDAELGAKAQDFHEAIESLTDHRDRMRASGGLPIVIDSNVLLECQRLDNLDWVAEVTEGARVMVPLRVVEEIDAKKHSDSARLRKIARRLLPWIDSLFPSGDIGPVALREGATIELLLAERPRYRPSDADEEILDVCHDVRHFAGRVKVMTGDTGMRVRATSEGIDVLILPEQWRRPTTEPESGDSQTRTPTSPG